MVKQQSLKESSFVKSERAKIKSKTYDQIWLIWVQGCLVGVWLLDSNSFPPPFCFSDTTLAFAERETFNINDGRNANKNYLLSSDSQSDGFCGVWNRANQPHGSHMKKHDTRLLIGCIAFLTCGDSDMRHLIGLHQFANENLLCGFSECKSQYVYNESKYFTAQYCLSLSTSSFTSRK